MLLVLSLHVSQQQALMVSGCANPTISQIKKKKEKGETHEISPSDVAIAIATERRLEH